MLGITTQQYGYIVAAFQAAYMVMQPVAGYVLDVLGTKLGFALFAGAWSVVCILHSTAGNWVSLAVFRAMLGVTEAAGFPSALRATSEWFPARSARSPRAGSTSARRWARWWRRRWWSGASCTATGGSPSR